MIEYTNAATVAGVGRLGIMAYEFARARKIPAGNIFLKSRKKESVWPRHDFWAHLKDDHGYSYSEIARLFDMDHTTVMHGVKNARERQFLARHPDRKTKQPVAQGQGDRQSKERL